MFNALVGVRRYFRFQKLNHLNVIYLVFVASIINK